MPVDLQSLAAGYADMQRDLINSTGCSALLKDHIRTTLKRCLPPSVVTQRFVNLCFRAVQTLPDEDDPMKTGAIHAWAGLYLQTAADASHPVVQKLHRSALKLLAENQPASRDDLRLVTLDALYDPKLIPAGIYTAFIRHRLELNGARLSCEEIAFHMHQPLVYIHELESAILTILSAKGDFHA